MIPKDSMSGYNYNRQNDSPRGEYPRKKYRKKFPLNNEPITSYGLILYCIVEGQPMFLLYQRRDSFEYMDFLRGVWSVENQLPSLFTLMSIEERQRIRDYTFKELWDDLWVEHTCRIYRDGYLKAKKKYDSVKNIIPQILDSTTSHIKSPPWGFPKGKKNGYHEDPIVCALREFGEETRIPTEEITIIQNIPYVENFKGSNGKAYSTHYFLAQIPSNHLPKPHDTPQCIRKTAVSEEASSVEWYTYEDACRLLNPRRQNILRSALEVIDRKS